jgi:hypothetical protein
VVAPLYVHGLGMRNQSFAIVCCISADALHLRHLRLRVNQIFLRKTTG